MRGVLLVLLIGCGGEPAPATDAGPRLDAARDAAVTPCARVEDCSTELVCNVVRCEPGNPMADARGCMVEPLCVAGQRCEGGTCVRDCTPEEADRDGDGDRNPECGGNDCDDDDSGRNSGRTEICDPAHVDEDCNPRTFGPDLDEDGHDDAACCNMLAEGLRCGGDCDDGTPLVNPDRTELCNGVDDDCAGGMDDTFACPQSSVLPGMNACGREGQRRCSDACGWLDDGFYREEAADTCDYCDDTGRGLMNERVVATATAVNPAWFVQRYGSGSCLVSAFVHCQQMRLIQAGSAQVGGATTMASGFGAFYAVVGYGPMTATVAATVSTPPSAPAGLGWSFWLVAEGGPALALEPAAQLGVPTARHGWALETRFDDYTALGRTDWDSVRLRYLGDGMLTGTTPAFGLTQDLNAGTGVVTRTQQFAMSISADDPSTPANETRIDFTFPSNAIPGFSTLSASCSGDACRGRIVPGERYYFGYSAGSAARTSTVVVGVATPLDAPALVVTSAVTCP